MHSEKSLVRLEHILENIERVELYVVDCDFQRFTKDGLRRDAIERCLSRISEAARKLGDIAEQLAPDQPWADIRELGNRLRHDYERVDPIVVWGIVTEHLHPLKIAVRTAVAKLQAKGDNE